jgi:hypothetical protein
MTRDLCVNDFILPALADVDHLDGEWAAIHSIEPEVLRLWLTLKYFINAFPCGGNEQRVELCGGE